MEPKKFPGENCTFVFNFFALFCFKFNFLSLNVHFSIFLNNLYHCILLIVVHSIFQWLTKHYYSIKIKSSHINIKYLDTHITHRPKQMNLNSQITLGIVIKYFSCIFRGRALKANKNNTPEAIELI